MIRFAHLSDTHVCKTYKGSLEPLFSRCQSPAENTAACFRRLAREQVDFVLMTGDLIHEGTAEDYAYLREIAEENLGGIPVVYVLGNHDRKQAFAEGMGLPLREGSLSYVKEFPELRVIVLDSGVDGKESGAISPEQEQWLAQVLAEKTEKTTILAFHHPIAWERDSLAMPVSPSFRQLVKNSGVAGIFCGHTHSNSLDDWEGIPQFTADSMAFGLGMEKDGLSFTNRTGYTMVRVENGTIQVHQEGMTPKPEAYMTFTWEQMEQMIADGSPKDPTN